MQILLIGAFASEYSEFKAILERLKHEITHAKSCKQGFKILEIDPKIDLVMIDADSSAKCNSQFLQSKRRNSRLSWTPVIMVGHSIDSETASLCLELGINDIIVLPVAEETLEAKICKASEDGKRTVLIVDDELPILEILKDSLELERFNVLSTTSAEEALDLLKTNDLPMTVGGRLGEFCYYDMHQVIAEALSKAKELSKRLVAIAIAIAIGYLTNDFMLFFQCN